MKKEQVKRDASSTIMSREVELKTLRNNGFKVEETSKGTFITKPQGHEFNYRIKN